ncbi:PqiB family protein [Thalassotalea crassostreae]|uniref:PqiB family protein n=1 Tax=Thalassotalea crassostreae TaxID=1763536 RepID=UPI000837E2C4|nr:MlaD family protein [Thalassotalea crassostreae]
MKDAEVVLTNKSPISSIWLLPVLAVLIALWLVFKSFSEAGVDIIIKTTSAEGIVAGKTEVRFKGFPIGLVTDLDMTEDLQTVLATVELKQSTKQYLTENTLFWLVKPEISLSGVSGLDTVITGNYFEMLPMEGETQVREYTSLKQPPPKSEDAAGLHITLHAKELGSITHGSKIFYKQIQVGEVYSYEFSKDKSHIKINLLIEEEYRDLIKLNTRFWNASGIEMTGDLSGFKVRTQSMASVIGGGIAFETPELGDTTTIVQNFTEYPLYEGFDEAKSGITVKMHFPKNSGIKAGITKVIFEGVEVGVVEDFVYNQARGGVTASVLIDPRLEPYLLSGMDFWLVKPSISLAGVSNIDRLLSGSYVAFRIGDGEPSREFDVLPSAPPLDFKEKGLHLNITADNVDSLSFGVPVFYKNLRVGSVQDHKLAADKRSFDVHIFIEPEYESLVNSSSVFYEQGGIEVNGSLKSFSIRTSPIQALMTGGISFHTIDFENSSSVKDGHRFVMNRNLEEALNTEVVTIIAPLSYEIIPGLTKLKFGEKHIGTVKSVKPSSDFKSSIVTIGYQSDYNNLFKESSKIWIVEPNLTAGNIAGFNALLTGMFLQVKPGEGALKNHFTLLRKAPESEATDEGLQLRLHAKYGTSVEKGSPISYKKMVIGFVDTVNLNKDGLTVDISATIAERFRYLVSKTSKFHQASGFNVKANLKGLNVQTESLQSILRGGLALNNDYADFNNLAEEMDIFELYENNEVIFQTGKLITVTFNEVIDIQRGANVDYNGHTIGSVKNLEVTSDLMSTKLTLDISDKYSQFTQTNTQFWLVKPEVSVARVANAKAYFTGNYIGVMPGNGEQSVEFKGLLQAPALKQVPSGTNLTLTTSVKGSIQPDNPVLYRQIKVGRVLGIELNENANGVNVYLNIDEQYKHLVSKDSKFYNASGIKVEAGLFSGMNIETESMDTILAGGVAFVTPESNKETLATDGDQFPLYDEADESWLEWNPTLTKPIEEMHEPLIHQPGEDSKG